MSILQDYENHQNYLSKKKMSALKYYLKVTDKIYSDVVYQKKEWEEFEKWYNKQYGRGAKRNPKVQ